MARIAGSAPVLLLLGLFFCLASTGCRAQAMASPWGGKAGYYPGQAQGVRASEVGRWRQWIAEHREAILAIDSKWNAIQAGALQPGCIGRALFDCVASLGQTLVVSDWYQKTDLFYAPPLDVNGKPVLLKWIDLTAYLPGAKFLSESADDLSLRLELSDRNEIAEIAFAFDLAARTQEDYDRTGAYEIFSVVAQARCPQLSRNEFARFIENKLKPAIREVKIPHEPGFHDSKRNVTPFVRFCGRELQLSEGHARTFELKSPTNPAGEIASARLLIR